MKLAALVVCLASIAACGDDGGARKLPDAPPSDGELPDAPDPLAPARITITRAGAPVEGAAVYFQNADSTLVAKVLTDADGVAEATVMPGAFVTTVNPFLNTAPPSGARTDEIRTFGGVQPGDQLKLNETMRDAFAFVNVTVDENPLGIEYRMFSTCIDVRDPFFLSTGSGSGSAGRPTGTASFLNCGATTDLVVESHDGSGVPNGFLYKQNVAVVDGGAIDLTGPYQAMPAQTLTLTNVPASVGSFALRFSLAAANGPVWAVSNDAGVTSGTSTWSFQRPVLAGATAIVESTPLSGSQFGPQTVVDWKPIADAQTYSYADALLRPFTAAPTYDVATHAMTWTEGSGAAPDFVVGAVQATRNAGPLVWSWRLIGPATGPTLVYPTLPPEIAQYNFLATDNVSISDLATAKVPGGYSAAFRSLVFAASKNAFLHGAPYDDFVAGASGRAVVQTYFELR